MRRMHPGTPRSRAIEAGAVGGGLNFGASPAPFLLPGGAPERDWSQEFYDAEHGDYSAFEAGLNALTGLGRSAGGQRRRKLRQLQDQYLQQQYRESGDPRYLESQVTGRFPQRPTAYVRGPQDVHIGGQQFQRYATDSQSGLPDYNQPIGRPFLRSAGSLGDGRTAADAVTTRAFYMEELAKGNTDAFLDDRGNPRDDWDWAGRSQKGEEPGIGAKWKANYRRLVTEVERLQAEDAGLPATTRGFRSLGGPRDYFQEAMTNLGLTPETMGMPAARPAGAGLPQAQPPPSRPPMADAGMTDTERAVRERYGRGRSQDVFDTRGRDGLPQARY